MECFAKNWVQEKSKDVDELKFVNLLVYDLEMS